MPVRFAFAGFRHPHIVDMYSRCRQRDDIEVVALCEEDSSTRADLSSSGQADVTHDRLDAMLDEVDCDVVAVGDCYGRRAEIILAALERGKHVISDKPLCVSLEELDRIEAAASEAERVVGCMLDMRDLPVFRGLRQVLREGRIGQVQALSFDGQHPLLYGKRPGWYFEPGMHGGVLNDIIVHAVDFIPWATGLAWEQVVAARCWNATVAQHPEFSQCGQAMLQLNNGAGVICDVSYLTPDSFGYTFPMYWRFTIWGAQGVLEAGVNSTAIRLFQNGRDEVELVTPPAATPGAYLDAFLAEVAGQPILDGLTSRDVFAAARVALLTQLAADEGSHAIAVPGDPVPA